MDSNVRNEAWSTTTQPTFTWTPKGGTLSNWKVSSQSKQKQVYPPKLANAKKNRKLSLLESLLIFFFEKFSLSLASKSIEINK